MRLPRMPPRRLVLAALAALALAVSPAGAAEPVWVTTLPLPPQGHDILSAFPDGTAYVEHTNGGSNALYRSTDFGRTWMPMAAPPATGGTAFVRFATPKVGYTVGYGTDRAYRTADGGATWKAVTPYPVPKGKRFVAGAFAVTGRTILVSGTLERDGIPAGCGPRSGAVMWSNDEGRTWRRTVLPTGATVTPGWSVKTFGTRSAALVFYEEDDECATYFDSTAVWVTHDGGRTFARRAACPVICTAVGLASRDRLLVGRVNGTTAISDDGGRTFREGQRLTDYSATGDTSHAFWVQAFTFVGRTGYASTKGGGTWRTTSGGTAWTQEVLTHESGFGVGIGEVVAFDAGRAMTGGPGFVSIRTLVGP